MENSSANYDEILAAGEGKIKESKTTKAIAMGYLPEEGTFTGWDVVSITNDEGETNWYYELYTTNGGKISMNTVQALAFFGVPTVDNLKPVVKEGSLLNGLCVLKGVSSVNPNFSGNQAKVLSGLIGKAFTTEIKSGKIVPYGKNKATAAATLKEVVSKDFYRITLKS